MPDYFASVFWKSRFKTKEEKGYQGTNYKIPYPTKQKARIAAQKSISQWKKDNPKQAKTLKFSAHVATLDSKKKSKPKKSQSFWDQYY